MEPRCPKTKKLPTIITLGSAKRTTSMPRWVTFLLKHWNICGRFSLFA